MRGAGELSYGASRAWLDGYFRSVAYHLRYLAEDATDPELSSVERLALVQDRARKIREIRRIMTATPEAQQIAARPHP